MKIDFATRRGVCNIGLVGPALSGKTEFVKELFATHRSDDALCRYQHSRFWPIENPSLDETEYMSLAEAEWAAPYDELTESGTLLSATFPCTEFSMAGFDLYVVCQTVSGHAWHDVFRRHVLERAEVVIFVADPRPERHDAVVEAWENLTESWDGPVVTFAPPGTQAWTEGSAPGGVHAKFSNAFRDAVGRAIGPAAMAL